jgi:hypothetical protein
MTEGRVLPIIFSAPMVRALLAGTKTQTRRIMKPQPELTPTEMWHVRNAGGGVFAGSEAEVEGIGPDYARWQVGDRLWVRENFALVPSSAYRMSDGVTQAVNPSDGSQAAIYAAGWDRSIPKWKPSIHMPRWASRLTLAVTDVRVQRLQNCSEDDAKAEGVQQVGVETGQVTENSSPIEFGSYLAGYAELWDQINGDGAWDANPWVVALTFAVHRGNIDTIAAGDHIQDLAIP